MAKSTYPHPTQVGRMLKAARLRAGITQATLARQASVDVAVISRLERGLHSPTLQTLAALAEGLGVPIGRILP